MKPPRLSRLVSFRTLLGIVAIAGVVPLFCARHLPIADLPEHVAAMATIRHYWDASWRSQEYFVLAGANETPYWLYHAIGAALSVVTGSAERANLVMMALVGLAYPYALRELLVALRRDPRLALFGPVLFWTQNLTVGLLNFVASVPFVLWGLSLVVRQTRAPSRKRGAGLAVLSVAILYLHISAFAMFVAQTLVLSLLAPGPVESARALLKRAVALPQKLVWLVPSFVCAVSIALAGRAGADHQGHGGVVFQSRMEVLRKLPAWLFDLFRTKMDDVLGWGLVLALVLLVGFGAQRKRNDAARFRTYTVVALFLVSVATYAVMPAQVGAYAFLLDVRMSVFVGCFAVLLPSPRRTKPATLAHAFVFVFALGMATNAAYEVHAFARDDVGNFDALLQRMPRGARLLSMDHARYSTRTNGSVLHHYGSFYRARYGGIASFSFSEMPHWPVQYRTQWLPPKPMTWGDPRAFDNARDGDYFDFVLTHGDALPFANRPPGPEWEVIGVARAFRLYRKVKGTEERKKAETHAQAPVLGDGPVVLRPE